ncbi:MAG: MarR family transcriptional regulator [Sphingomonadaceae bacterium]|nr:MarR family transcriptional regulator [Sphingomonadaceae bacterium]
MTDEQNSSRKVETGSSTHWPTDFGFDLADTTRIFRKVFNLRVEQYGITGPQWRIIAYLMRCDGMTQVEIADEIELDKAAIGRTIERLEARGLVRRENCDKDRRARRVYLKPEAVELGNRIRQEAQEFYRDVLAAATPAEEAKLSFILGKVRGQLIEMLDSERSKKSHAKRLTKINQA